MEVPVSKSMLKRFVIQMSKEELILFLSEHVEKELLKEAVKIIEETEKEDAD